ncbi:MAG: c-type cytochrome [Desulfobacterales bacterium]|nr:c-type cytochrome [Desulfobacterales bacterium]
MKKVSVKGKTLFALVPAMVLVLTWGASFAEKKGNLSGEGLAEIAEGGRLYDKWWGHLKADAPHDTHPSYPKTGQQKGSATWRCKECHGWDYKGTRGAYKEGSHYTGIAGIRNAAGISALEIQKILIDETHRFKKLIPDNQLKALAAFVKSGQVEMELYIQRATKKAKGDPEKGSRIYQTLCAQCHGQDGKLLNFSGNPQNPEYMGTVANRNPWEALHKIRHGQPGEKMPSMLAFSVQDQIDTLAYTQTLPEK